MIQNQLAGLGCAAGCCQTIGLEVLIPGAALTCIHAMLCACLVKCHQFIPVCNLLDAILFHQIASDSQYVLTKLVLIVGYHVNLSVNLCLAPCKLGNCFPDFRCIGLKEILCQLIEAAQSYCLLVMSPA